MEAKDILKQHGIRPFKGFGQNFLTNTNILDKIVEAANINGSDTILEIGPGLGILTKELAKKAKKVIAVEKDKNMVGILRETIKNTNVEIINEDALEYSPSFNQYKIVANLPYYITSPIIRKFLEADSQPELMVLMVQKEVAQRICTNPPNMSILSVSVQFYAKPEIVSYVSKESFWPKPKVDSAILKITDINKRENSDLFFKIVKAGFSQPRKQLVNNLSKVLKINREITISWLSKNDINPNQRAETLKVEQWLELTKTFDTILT